MKRILVILTAVCFVLVAACDRKGKTPSREELLHQIDSVETVAKEASPLEPVNPDLGKAMVEMYVNFADTYPDDTLSASYLHKAAQICNNLDMIDEMVEYYDRVIDNYPNYDKMAECYYEKGINLDNAGRKAEAREAYQAFLEEYPDHFLADDISKAMKLLDLSDEQLLQFLADGK